MPSLRAVHDFIALFTHVITVAVIIIHNDPLKNYPVPATALVIMQLSALCFHFGFVMWHVLGYYNIVEPFDKIQNQFKWIEYAVSATAGTIAVLSVESVDLGVIIPISCAAVFQQLGGMLLDYQKPNGLRQPLLKWTRTGSEDSVYPIIVPFVGAWILQSTEFYFAIERGGPTILKVTYVLFWSLFGIHCGLALYGFQRNKWVRYNDPAWVETVYSCLGWTSKLAVFAVEWAYLNGENEGHLLLFANLNAFLLCALLFTV